MLGISKDAYANIEYDRVKTNELFIKHLCAVFGINEGWLKDGIGEMYSKGEDGAFMEKFVLEVGASEFEKKLLTAYFAIDERVKEKFINILIDEFKKQK